VFEKREDRREKKRSVVFLQPSDAKVPGILMRIKWARF